LVHKIKSSLSAKIFINITAILLIVSIVIFWMLRIIMPRAYQHQLDSQLMSNAGRLVAQLEDTPQDQWRGLVSLFVAENSAGVTILNGDDGLVSGISSSTVEMPNDYESSAFYNSSFSFEQNDQEYEIIITSVAIVNSVQQMEGIFAQVFPYVFLAIVLVAILTAFFYTRSLAKPIVEIANASKKMVNLDLQWHYEVKRNDEVGMLANNLNQMASKLGTTLQELQTANEQLQADIEKERERERRRRDFFTAVSHELKTPVTILKGELDGMILNVGKFKDRDKYLQEAYQTSESIEKLVREIMTLAKLDNISLKLESIIISDMIKAVSSIYEKVAHHKQIDLKLDLEAEVIVLADPTQLQTVISNIISNAINYSPEGQSIEIN